ncbi:hypothetical protein DCCM_4218 [Desulfocucumis palustris]|uniref:Uncharacterized protein n=1 Tax=Desulfocucumis palustris TaxID=1898651 RepID=A0A2L2XFU8_9FIRM|nr:hypothetical protein DCCM_4218 [Desulfocucumis palustris]
MAAKCPGSRAFYFFPGLSHPIDISNKIVIIYIKGYIY